MSIVTEATYLDNFKDNLKDFKEFFTTISTLRHKYVHKPQNDINLHNYKKQTN